ncbi:MAG TPA: hypothetical protein VF950_17240 [Planctomycetota bacterium]
MNLRPYAVPLATFALALALSLAIAPVPRLSARALQAMTGGGGCDTFMEIPERDTWLPRGNEGGEETEKGNAILVRLKWEPVGTWDGTTRKFTFRFEGPPALKGICDNKGKESYPDFTVEQGDNAPWKIDDGIPQYPGDQNVAAVTRNSYPPGVWVDILVRSYDFGAWTKVVGAAEGCPEKKERIPKDTDEDTLPDVWELGKRFFDDSGATLTYDIASPSTFLEELDGASDRDGGFLVQRHGKPKLFLESGKLHDELGDGFSAFEEYRGVFVQGAFFRMDELENDGGGEVAAGNRGTKLKNVFVYDPDVLISNGSAVLNELGVGFHRIRQDEMSTEIQGNGEPLAGFVDFNSVTKDQHAIWIRDRVIPGTTLGDSGSFTVNATPNLIDVDVPEIQLEATTVVLEDSGITPSFEELRDFTVAHEIAHKFSLKHPEDRLFLRRAGPSKRYDETVYWYPTAGDQTLIQTWSLVERYRRNGGPIRFRLLTRVPPLQGVGEPATTQVGDPLGWVDHGEPSHKMVHMALVREYDFPAGDLIQGSVAHQPHTGSLIDWNAEYQRLDPPLYSDQAIEIKVKP